MPLEAGAVELMTLQTSLGTEAREDKIWNDAQLTSRRNGHQHVQIPLCFHGNWSALDKMYTASTFIANAVHLVANINGDN